MDREFEEDTINRFDGTYVVVTGAGSGIGRATALAFATAGAAVAAVDVDDTKAAEIAREIESLGVEAVALQADVGDAAAVERAFDRLPFPEVTTLVNNAGVREITPFTELAVPDWERIIAINLHGAFYCTKAAYPKLRKPGGSIVNVSSVAGLVGVPGRVAYSAAKHGLIGLTRGLADDLGAEGVRVNAVCPGVTETPLTARYFDNSALVQDLRRATPLRRWGTAAEIAAMITFLSSDAAGFCTGGVYAVDGGYTATKGFG